MKYHKIQTIFKRDMSAPKHPLIYGDWTKPEFEYLQYNDWLFTEKIDGTNIRIYWQDGQIRVEGRNDNSNIPGRIIDYIKGIPKESMNKLYDGTVLYGEGCGPGIQKNMGFYTENKGQEFVLFDVADAQGRFYSWSTVVEIATCLRIRFAPVVGIGDLHKGIEMVRQEIFSHLGNGPSEGLVLRPLTELQNKWGERIICKIKTRDFA